MQKNNLNLSAILEILILVDLLKRCLVNQSFYNQYISTIKIYMYCYFNCAKKCTLLTVVCSADIINCNIQTPQEEKKFLPSSAEDGSESLLF